MFLEAKNNWQQLAGLVMAENAVLWHRITWSSLLWPRPLPQAVQHYAGSGWVVYLAMTGVYLAAADVHVIEEEY